MDRRAWWAAALGVAKSQTQLSDQTTTTKSPSLWCFAKETPGLTWGHGVPSIFEASVGLAAFMGCQ